MMPIKENGFNLNVATNSDDYTLLAILEELNYHTSIKASITTKTVYTSQSIIIEEELVKQNKKKHTHTVCNTLARFVWLVPPDTN